VGSNPQQQYFYLQTQYQRLVNRRGKKKTAVAHSIIVIAYRILKKGLLIKNWAAITWTNSILQTLKRYYVKRLETLGFKVAIEPINQAA